jgi:hypothetical protein
MIRACGLLAVLVVLANSAAAGDAQSGTGRTLTFYESLPSGYRFIDVKPMSPTRNLGSRRVRLSIGDRIVTRTAVYDRPGGTRIGTARGMGTVVAGGKLRTARVIGGSVFVLSGGQIVTEGEQRLGDLNTPVAIVGGTGAYEGARGSASNAIVNGTPRVSIHLLG